MTNKDIEIEAKFKVLDINFIKNWLNKYAKFISGRNITDTYYTPTHRDFLDVEYPYEWLRIRNEEKEVSLNYKHWYPENSLKSTHCDEFETSVSSEETLRKILTVLNFKKIAIVDKHRDKYMIDDFEFCLDNVVDLGFFLEIEYNGEELNIQKANQEFEKFQRYLSSAIGERNYRGYPYLIIEKARRS